MLPSCKSSSALFIVTLLLLLLSRVHAADNALLQEALTLTPEPQAAEEIFELCASCHGEDGFGLENGEYPSIAGQHQRVILKQLLDIQAKLRINPTMFPFSDPETLGGLQGMSNIAAYAAQLVPNPNPVTGDGDRLDRGEKLYLSHCTACHGPRGQGNAEHFFPRLTHQHYPYLVREMIWIRDKVRKNADPAMTEILANFNNEDIQSVADYLSRIRHIP